jgi:hypothetical protein
VVGSLETLNLRVALINDGDPAHHTHLVITLPTLPNSMPVGCKEITNSSQVAVQVECEAANPLRRETPHIFLFGLDAETSAADTTHLNASVKINTATDNENFNTLSELSLPLSLEADVEVYGYLKLLSFSTIIYASNGIFRRAVEENYFFGAAKGSEPKNVKNIINATVLIQV